MTSPIQVVLDPKNYIRDFERPPGGGSRDFYEGNDAAFVSHRDALATQVRRLAASPTAFRRSRVAVASVELVHDALAKSNRPTALIDSKRLPPVGIAAAGELLVQVTADSLSALANRIADAPVELRKRERVNQDTGEIVETMVATQARCDVGAIDKINLWTSERKLPLSQRQLEQWFEQDKTPRSLIVQLFTFDDAIAGVAREERTGLLDRLHALGCSTQEQTLGEGQHATDYLLVNLAAPSPSTTPADAWRTRLDPATQLLRESFLVRSIALPARLIESTLPKGLRLNQPVDLPARVKGKRYPVVGIVDGGLAKPLAEWVVFTENLISPAHADPDHGTYIGGLLTAGRFLNGASVTDEEDGCDLADLCVLPADNSGTFNQYYQTVPMFMDELDRLVEVARRDHGVRVFNFSTNFEHALDPDQYAYETRRLDEIARKHDVIFVISAGNLHPNAFRPEWPEDDMNALRMLAAARQDQILGPADSITNVSVASVNSPGLNTFVSQVPAAYSRRGPSPFGGVKPDVAHFGGCATGHGKSSGMHSTCPKGTLISQFGTSFAAPLVAKTLARYATEIQGELSREMMIALLVHHARVPDKLLSANFEDLARDLVGFGIPQDAVGSLAGDSHSATIVFSESIPRRKRLEFDFEWPASLTKNGKCRGRGRLTLVAQPELDSKCGHEVVRTQLDGHVIQLGANGKKRGGHFQVANMPKMLRGKQKIKECELIRHALKWSPVKMYTFEAPQGKGESSKWRLTVECLERTPGEIPKDGTRFVAILTIEDIDEQAPVFDDLRRSLVRNGVRIADIQIAAKAKIRM